MLISATLLLLLGSTPTPSHDPNSEIWFFIVWVNVNPSRKSSGHLKATKQNKKYLFQETTSFFRAQSERIFDKASAAKYLADFGILLMILILRIDPISALLMISSETAPLCTCMLCVFWPLQSPQAQSGIESAIAFVRFTQEQWNQLAQELQAIQFLFLEFCWECLQILHSLTSDTCEAIASQAQMHSLE